MTLGRLLGLSLGAFLAVNAMAQPERPIKKSKEKKESVTQALEPLPEPPNAIAAETAKLVFHVSPLSAKGLLSQQIRDALKAIDKARGNATLVKLRAFVAGTGDMRRVQAIVAEDFSDRKLPLPAITTIQVGALPLTGAQVVLEAVSQSRTVVNPNGLAFLSAQPAKDIREAVALLQKSARATLLLRVTCFLSSLDEIDSARSQVATAFPMATSGHWHSKLGPSYPYGQSPPPRPGSINGAGCQPAVQFPGATIVDLPTEGLYDQELAATFDRHIAAAAAAGIRGFLASWKGSGRPSQDPGGAGYGHRLELLVTRVNAYNRTHSKHFGLGLALAAFGDYNRSAAAITGDLAYFSQRYGKDPAFKNDYSDRPVVMWLDSRKYKIETVREVSTAARPSLYLVGDETPTSWPRDGQWLDAGSYYWSTQNPTSKFSRSSIASLAAAVHGAGKPWLAPFIAGYNKELAGGGCIPRNGTKTLDNIWAMNATSQPDGWFGISWNEFVENTYLEPTQAYGTTYLDELKRLIATG